MRIAFMLTALLYAIPAYSHPGRLSKYGCHEVSRDYKYDDGRAIKKGDYHCHRPIGKTKLDGLERLQEPDEVQKRKEMKTR